MLSDLRTRAKLREFFGLWLRLDHVGELVKDSQEYPDFTEEVASDLRDSLELFVEDVVWSDRSDYRELFTKDALLLNRRLAKFYGQEFNGDAEFQPVKLDADQRAGVLTHPFLLTAFAYTDTSSPIHRGVFITRSVLGRSLRPPPDAVTPVPAKLHPDLTTRERIALQTKPENCASCHSMINPLGFTLEHFDAVGRFRLQEKGKPIDASGGYLTREGELQKFNGVKQLAQFIVQSAEAREAFCEQLFHYLIKQPINAYGNQQTAHLQAAFQQQEYNIRQLVVQIASEAAAPRAVPKP